MMYRVNGGPLTMLFMLLVLGVFLYAIGYLFIGAYKYLLYITPLLLLGAALVNYKVYSGLWMKIRNRFSIGFLPGVLYVALLVLGLPFVGLQLLVKAFILNRVKKFTEEFNSNYNNTRTEYASFEEVSSVVENQKSVHGTPVMKRINTSYIEDIEFEEEKK